jgi:hypothetical protein
VTEERSAPGVTLVCARPDGKRKCRRPLGEALLVDGHLHTQGGVIFPAVHDPTGYRSLVVPCRKHGVLVIGEDVVIDAIRAGKRAVGLNRRGPRGIRVKRPESAS